MSEEDPPESGSGCLRKGTWLIGIIVVIFLFLPFFARDMWVLELPFHLIFGSIIHGLQALSHFAKDLPHLMTVAILPCLATLIALWGAHRLILWWRLANGNESGWNFKHTALAGSLVLLGSAAAIALSGVIHEAAWLPQGKITKRNHSTTLTVVVNNAHQLGFALIEYEAEHKKYPSSLLDLREFGIDSMSLQRMIYVDLDTPGPPEPFVLLKGGREAGHSPSEIIMIGPQMPENGKFAVLKADGSVSHLPPEKFIEVVKSANDAAPHEK